MSDQRERTRLPRRRRICPNGKRPDGQSNPHRHHQIVMLPLRGSSPSASIAYECLHLPQQPRTHHALRSLAQQALYLFQHAWPRQRRRQPSRLPLLLEDPRVFHGACQIRQYARAMIVPLNDQHRTVVLAAKLCCPLCQLQQTTSTLELRALQPGSRIQHLHRRIVAFTSTACRIYRHQVLASCHRLQPYLQRARPAPLHRWRRLAQPFVDRLCIEHATATRQEAVVRTLRILLTSQHTKLPLKPVAGRQSAPASIRARLPVRIPLPIAQSPPHPAGSSSPTTRERSAAPSRSLPRASTLRKNIRARPAPLTPGPPRRRSPASSPAVLPASLAHRPATAPPRNSAGSAPSTRVPRSDRPPSPRDTRCPAPETPATAHSPSMSAVLPRATPPAARCGTSARHGRSPPPPPACAPPAHSTCPAASPSLEKIAPPPTCVMPICRAFSTIFARPRRPFELPLRTIRLERCERPRTRPHLQQRLRQKDSRSLPAQSRRRLHPAAAPTPAALPDLHPFQLILSSVLSESARSMSVSPARWNALLFLCPRTPSSGQPRHWAGR